MEDVSGALSISRLERGYQGGDDLGVGRVLDPKRWEALDNLARHAQEAVGDPAKGERMRGIEKRIDERDITPNDRLGIPALGLSTAAAE